MSKLARLSWGLEVEWYAVKPGTSKPFSTSKLLKVADALNPRLSSLHGKIATEPGESAGELITLPGSTIEECIAHLEGLKRALEMQRVGMAFSIRPPFPPSENVFPDHPTDRTTALWQAAAAECDYLVSCGHLKQFSRLGLLNHHAATHLNVRNADLEVSPRRVDQAMVNCANVVNYFGPRIARLCSQMAGIAYRGQLGIFYGWAADDRFSQPLYWFQDFRDLKQKFEARVRLITSSSHGGKGSSGWRVDRQTSMQWGNKDDEGSGQWPYGRLRTSFGGLEVRVLPSGTPQQVRVMTTPLAGFLTAVMCHPDASRSFRSVREMMRTELGDVICSFPFGGVTIPSDYSPGDWIADVGRNMHS